MEPNVVMKTDIKWLECVTLSDLVTVSVALCHSETVDFVLER